MIENGIIEGNKRHDSERFGKLPKLLTTSLQRSFSIQVHGTVKQLTCKILHHSQNAQIWKLWWYHFPRTQEPIIDQTGTCYYDAAKVIANLLKSLAENYYVIKNTQSFPTLLNDLPPLQPDGEEELW